MANKMLIDASHPEETRVVVVRGQKVEEFDFESSSRRQLRGNIYLAKVTRVEPSLQAAFVEYGGNRHGFLAFSEIHPDYYQIPVADRQALLAEQAEEAAREEQEEERGARRKSRRDRSMRARNSDSVSAEATVSGDEASGHDDDASGETAADAVTFDDVGSVTELSASGDDVVETVGGEADGDVETAADAENGENGDDGEDEDDSVEQVGGADALEEVSERRFRSSRRQYKIQEVIKRRQILLVQVVKEERGNKGAALTTYLSLAGRYSVLMPNTARGGGISRKITNSGDRKRLKEIASALEVPQGMGIILRTAGASRTPQEVTRDFEYLLRLWESVRELTLKSSAPCLVYEEGSLIKRAIRDLYNSDIDDVLVSGDAGFSEARDFMRMLMPDNAGVVRQYKGAQPLYAHYGVEPQLDAMFSTHVTLKSGGYIVINPTEALVSIDVNSGRSTREHSIEDTALRTNLEAAEEISRQLRLRDLAGLIVIDFIDMEEGRNNRAVEKKLKECLKNDRARIQVGRISPFGLMEMSRQRIRTGVLESSSIPCPHCAGAGTVRSVPSIALQVLRMLEEALIRNNSHNLNVRTRTEVALYILNQKRNHLRDLESRFGVEICVLVDDTLIGQTHYHLERGEPATGVARAPATGVQLESFFADDTQAIEGEAIEIEAGEDEREEAPAAAGEQNGDNGDSDNRRRRRRRRRRGGRGEDDNGFEGAAGEVGDDDRDAVADAGGDDADAGLAGEGPAQEAVSEEAGAGEGATDDAGDDAGERGGRRRRRGRRGGRRDERDGGPSLAPVADYRMGDTAEPAGFAESAVVETGGWTPFGASEQAQPDAAAAEPSVTASEPQTGEAAAGQTEPADAAAEPAPDAASIVAATPEPETVVLTQETDPARPRRSGWWSRKAG
ncbi:Rne/Rng family ribonuclease [Camelimonas lactis]|uniref:Ribonuclease E n=1 Tax=Camelimonas lactis TaxID=659006 RepID=A0A4R2GM67_9HYPH|nr:ribonuclease E/G [Camelimonas lactis]TCO10352.1 ribonuclease E [Camelimonas lactis]